MGKFYSVFKFWFTIIEILSFYTKHNLKAPNYTEWYSKFRVSFSEIIITQTRYNAFLIMINSVLYHWLPVMEFIQYSPYYHQLELYYIQYSQRDTDYKKLSFIMIPQKSSQIIKSLPQFLSHWIFLEALSEFIWREPYAILRIIYLSAG